MNDKSDRAKHHNLEEGSAFNLELTNDNERQNQLNQNQPDGAQISILALP